MSDIDEDDGYYEGDELDAIVIHELNSNCIQRNNQPHPYMPIDDLKYNNKRLFRFVIGKRINRYNRLKNIGISKNVRDIFTYSFANDFVLDEKALAYDTYKCLNDIDDKKYPIEPLYETMDKDKTYMSNEERKTRGLPTTIQNLALMKQPLPDYLSDKVSLEDKYWISPGIYCANTIDQYLDDIDVMNLSYDNAVIPLTLVVYATDCLVKNKMVKVYRLMFDAKFKDVDVMMETEKGNHVPVTVSLPVDYNECIDYVDDDVYRSITYDTTKRNTSERKHGKNIGKTIRRPKNRNNTLANV